MSRLSLLLIASGNATEAQNADFCVTVCPQFEADKFSSSNGS
jgi:hypothetical protein